MKNGIQGAQAGQITVGCCSCVAHIANYYLPLSKALCAQGETMKVFKKYVVSIVALMLFSSLIYADGNELLKQCIAAEKFIDTQEVQNEFDIGVCIGLTQGVRNTMQFMRNDGSIKVCLPENGINNGQAIRILVSYLKKNPASLHENRVVLTMLAFIDAYPCK